MIHYSNGMEEPLLEAPPSGAGGAPNSGWRPTFTSRLLELQEEFQSRRRRAWCRSLSLTEPTVRCLNSTRFCLVFSATAIATAAPWLLASAEALAALLIYFLAVPDALGVRCPWRAYHYRFDHSAEDLVAATLLRGAAVVGAYWAVPGLVYRRPYLIASAAIAGIDIPFAVAKLIAVKHAAGLLHRNPAVVALCALHSAFALAHGAAAEAAVAWARRRARLGLALPLYRYSSALTDDRESLLSFTPRTGAADEAAAAPDPGSRFYSDPAALSHLGAELEVHYKVALPAPAEGHADLGQDGVVLVHGFGGGVHSWRLVMQALADAAGVPVVAFDRPGFGESAAQLAS